jgi:hypothetical protein
LELADFPAEYHPYFLLSLSRIFDAHPRLMITQLGNVRYDYGNADPYGRYHYISAEKKF